jgi:alpha-N-arabinofuranosidase
VVSKPGLDRIPTTAKERLTGNFSYTEQFDSPELNPRWMFLRNPEMDRYHWGDGKLTIRASAADISQLESLSALFCRQQHTTFTAETEVRFVPQSENDVAGLALLQNEHYNFVLGKTLVGGRARVVLTRAERDKVVVGSAPVELNAPLRLKIEGDGRYYSFYYATDGEWHTLATGVDAVNLSTSRSGGFIGACIGLYASSAKQ